MIRNNVEVGIERAAPVMFEYATIAVPVAPFVEVSKHPDTYTVVVAELPLQIAPSDSPWVSETVTVVVAVEVVAPRGPSVITLAGVPDAEMYSVKP